MIDLKTTFIQRNLAAYMEQVQEAMKRAADRAGVGVTGDGINSISYEALQQGAGGAAKLSFYEYLRFVDMGVGRGHPLGGLQSMKVTLAASRKVGYMQVKDRVRKPKKIYSKTAYGKLGWLYGKLLYGYTEETVAALKAEFGVTT